MMPSYKAVLHGDHLEWADDVPEEARRRENAVVYVTFAGEPSDPDESRGLRMSDALARLAARGGPSGVGDALEWQCGERADRSLPGRDG